MFNFFHHVFLHFYNKPNDLIWLAFGLFMLFVAILMILEYIAKGGNMAGPPYSE